MSLVLLREWDSMKSIRCLFFRSDLQRPIGTTFTLPPYYTAGWWWPRPASIVPSGLWLSWKLLTWWVLFFVLGIGASRYRIFTVYSPDRRLVHYSLIFPKYFRFPFMNAADLQIGSTWTEPGFRGQGLAAYAVQEILRAERRPEQVYWYVVAENNLSSIHVAQKSSLELYGAGQRLNRWGSSLLGIF